VSGHDETLLRGSRLFVLLAGNRRQSKQRARAQVRDCMGRDELVSQQLTVGNGQANVLLQPGPRRLGYINCSVVARAKRPEQQSRPSVPLARNHYHLGGDARIWEGHAHIATGDIEQRLARAVRPYALGGLASTQGRAEAEDSLDAPRDFLPLARTHCDETAVAMSDEVNPGIQVEDRPLKS
jgi:hypothetical protein